MQLGAIVFAPNGDKPGAMQSQPVTFMNPIVVPTHGPTRAVLTLPDPESSIIYPDGLGFWSNPINAQSLWRDCLVTRNSEDDAIDKLAATAYLHGYRAENQGWASFMNIAWSNGACAAKRDVALEDLAKVIRGRKEAGQALFDAVLRVHGIAGTGHPLVEMRQLLLSVFQGESSLPPLGDMLRAAAIAGWLAVKSDHLVTLRAFQDGMVQPEGVQLGSWLYLAAFDWPAFMFREALARETCMTYKPTSTLESLGVAMGVERSLAAARQNNWGACGYLLDGIVRGRDYARNEPAQTLDVLEELGPGVKESEQIFDLLLGSDWTQASDAAVWQMAVKWNHYHRSEDAKGLDRYTALRTLQQMYDTLFCFGLLREVNKTCTTAEWINRAKGVPPAENPGLN
jgi:hypothetical protein